VIDQETFFGSGTKRFAHTRWDCKSVGYPSELNGSQIAGPGELMIENGLQTHVPG